MHFNSQGLHQQFLLGSPSQLSSKEWLFSISCLSFTLLDVTYNLNYFLIAKAHMESLGQNQEQAMHTYKDSLGKNQEKEANSRIW